MDGSYAAVCDSAHHRGRPCPAPGRGGPQSGAQPPPIVGCEASVREPSRTGRWSPLRAGDAMRNPLPFLALLGVACSGESALTPTTANVEQSRRRDERWASPSATSLRTTLAAGDIHTCGLDIRGAAYCCGPEHQRVRLGDGSTVTRSVPTRVATSLRFISITAGGPHSCGLTAIGIAYCWGANSHGELGDGGVEPHFTPARVVGDLRFVQIVAGGSHTCGLTSAGTAYCWGANNVGQLGDGTLINRASPTPVAGSLQFLRLAVERLGGANQLRADRCRQGLLLGAELRRTTGRRDNHGPTDANARLRRPAARAYRNRLFRFVRSHPIGRCLLLGVECVRRRR